MKPPMPVCKAFLVCEHVHRSPDNRLSLLNIHTAFLLDEFPAETPTSFAYVQLTDALGTYKLEVEVLDLQTGQPTDRRELITFTADTPHEVISYYGPLAGLYLPSRGGYDFIILCNGSELERQRFTAGRWEDS